MNLHIENLESFPWIALHGLLEEVGKVAADIVLLSGKKYKDVFIALADNKTLPSSDSLVIREEAYRSEEPMRIQQYKIRKILIN